MPRCTGKLEPLPSDINITAQRKAARGAKVGAGDTPISRIFRNEDSGYRSITVERPLRGNGDAVGKIVLGTKGILSMIGGLST